jgi:hypothetical protein
MTAGSGSNNCPDLGTIKATEFGDVCVVCNRCGFAEALPPDPSLDHVVLAEMRHCAFNPAATEPRP